MIVMRLRGRLGNQLFIYAFGRALQEKHGGNLILIDNENETGGTVLNAFQLPEKVKIISYQSGNKYNYYQMRAADYKKIKNRFLNSIQKEIDFRKVCKRNHLPLMSFAQTIKYLQYKLRVRNKTYRDIYELERIIKSKYAGHGLALCENGYLNFCDLSGKNIFGIGYFQSELYFKECSDIIRNEITIRNKLKPELVNFINMIHNSESVCLSIRMGDYMNNPVHGVCSFDYYQKAIDKIYELVPEARIFVFSDNIADVMAHFKFHRPVSIEPEGCNEWEKLTYMSACKYFILSNSSFSWWVQYLSDYKSKIVIAPDHWFAIDVPCDIYQDDWIIMKVEKEHV